MSQYLPKIGFWTRRCNENTNKHASRSAAVAVSLSLGFLIVAFSGCSDSTSPGKPVAADAGTGGVDAANVPEVPRAQCSSQLSEKTPLPTNLPEAESYAQYDAVLAAIDLNSLPETIDFRPLDRVAKATVAYMLKLESNSFEQLPKSEILANQPMGKSVLGAFVVAKAPITIDMNFLRRGLYRFYQCDRGFPLSLADFKTAVFDYTSLEATTSNSIPKLGLRRVRSDNERGISIAETLVDNQVRETEILFRKTRTDGNLDFAVYDADGALTNRSTFATPADIEATGATPFICMSCHFNRDTMKFDLEHPRM